MRNAGFSTVSGISVKDTLNMSDFVSASWTCDSTLSTATCPASMSSFTASNGTLTATQATSLSSQTSLWFIVKAVIDPAKNPTGITLLPNKAAITAATPASTRCSNNPTQNNPVWPCEVTANAELSPLMQVDLTKTASVTGPLYIGQEIEYLVVASNPGNVPTTGKLTDALPEGLAVMGTPTCEIQAPGSPPPTPTACPAPASPADITSSATIPALGKLTYVFRAQVTSIPASGNVVNSATWTPADPTHTMCAPDAASPSAAPCPSKTVTVSNPVQTPILTITNVLDRTTDVAPGSTVNYTVTATNTGPVAASNMTVTLGAPVPSTGLSSITWTCVEPAGPPGIPCADVSESTTTPGTYVVSTPVPKDGFITFKGVAQVSTASTLQSGDTVSLTASDSTAPIVNACDATNCQATATFTITKPVLAITNQVLPNTLVAPNSSVTYTVVVTNTSNADAFNVQVTGPLPASGVASIAWSCKPVTNPVCAAANLTLAAGNDLTAALANLPAKASVTFEGVATTAAQLPGSAPISLTATTTTNPVVHNCDAVTTCQAIASFTTIGPQLSITNTVAIDPSKRALVKAGPTLPGVVPGKYVIYTIVATNSGKVDAPNVRVYTDAPANLTFTNWECTGTCPTPTAGTGALDQTIVNLPVNAVATFKVYAQVSASAPNNQDIVLTATDSTSLAGMLQCGAGTFVAAGPAGTPVASCTDTATLNTADAPVLSITNTVTPDKAPAGTKTNLVYKIIVTNTAGSPVTDALIKTGAAPANVTLGDWTCTASDNKSCPAASGGPGPIDVKVASYPVGVTLTFTLKATLEKTAEKGDILPLNATVAPETMLAKCAGTPLTDAPCQKEATVTVTAAVVADGALAVPTNAWWMLLTLASLMLGAAAMVQREALKKKAMQATRR